ncbi:MAG: ribonuclease J [Oceanicoccus sp.]|jgi:ribonuclease J
MSNVDKISAWIKETVHGGTKATESKPGPDSNSPTKPAEKKPQHSQHQKPNHPAKHRPQQPQGHKPSSPVKKTAPKKPVPVHKDVMRVIPIGGLEEVGKNSMLVEYEDELIMIDAGFQFAEDEMFGVDYVIPDIQYAVERKKRIKGLLITHGHLDHIGGLPWILPGLGYPTIYSYKLTLGLIRRILDEHKMTNMVQLVEIDNKKPLHLGKFTIDTFRVNHSIPDAFGYRLKTPQGAIVHTGDFKFDFTPADGVPCDLGKMSQIGKEGIDILLTDSTGSTKPGHTPSERVIGESLERAIKNTKGRLIVTCFSSLIGRIQQIMNFAMHNNRKIFLCGRSIEKNVEMAIELGFIKVPKDLIVNMRQVGDYRDEQILVLTTGSQGEPMAALSRMATEAHRHLKVKKGDTIVMSATAIIGNERSVAHLVDALSRLGAHIIHSKIMDVHTSGHGYQEDLKMMMSLIKPNHLVPVHGNYYMRRAHGDLGLDMGIAPSNIHMLDNGNVIEIRKGQVSFKHEDVKTKYVVVDGLGQGDLTSQVLKDRAAMAENGIIHVVLKMKQGQLIGVPFVNSSGFVYATEQERVIETIKKRAKDAAMKLAKRKSRPNLRDYQHFVRGEVRGYVLKELNRRPLIDVTIIRV